MNCDAAIDLMLFSNGSLACGKVQHKDWVPFDPTLNYWSGVVNGPPFDEVREKLRNNLMPFGDHCTGCAVLNEAHTPPQKGGRVYIHTFEVEPTVSCNISCLSCERIENRKNYRTPYIHGHTTLDVNIFEKIVTDLVVKIDVGTVEFQGWGEPTLNRHLGEMSKIAKEAFPNSRIQLVTNAQGKHHDWNFDHAFDAIVYSVDGVDQNSYARYREGSSFPQAVEFIHKQIVAEKAKTRHAPIKHTWKYILFDHTDSNENLETLYRLASEADMDEIRLTFTQYGPVSHRFFPVAQALRQISSDRSLCDVNDTIDFKAALAALNKAGLILPLPKCFFDAPDGMITFSVIMTAAVNVSANVGIVKQHIASGNLDEARRFLNRGMFILWNLYKDVGFDLMSREDEKIADELQGLSAAIPRDKLDSFYHCYAKLRPDRNALLERMTWLANRTEEAVEVERVRIRELEEIEVRLTAELKALRRAAVT